MERLLIRTNAAIEDCERHLTVSNTFGTEIESYLTQYLLVIMCADVQQEIHKLSEERASVANDVALSSFIGAAARKVVRSVGKKEIGNFVEMFGPQCKTRLNSQIEEAEVTIYGNAVGFRHDVAHHQGSLISFKELKEAVAIAEKLLHATAYSIEPLPQAVDVDAV